MSSRVGRRGQITLDKAIRQELGIHPGDEAIQRIEGGRILIEMVPGRHSRSLAGEAAKHVRRRPLDESWGALRSAAWAAQGPDQATDV